MLDIAIIGAGPIGLYAGILSSLHNLNGAIFEARDKVGGQLKFIYPQKDIIDIPGQVSVTAEGFIDLLYKQMMDKENHPELHLNESVLDIKPVGDYYTIKTPLGKYDTKTILISSGMGNFSPRKIGIPGEDDYENIIYAVQDKNLYKDKNIVILGGGDSAVDWALMLKPLAKDVSIIHRRKEFRAQSSSVDKMKSMGVKVYTPFNTIGLNGEENVLKSIVIEENPKEIDPSATPKKETIPLDVLFVNFGMVPGQNNFPMEKNGLNIKVGDCYETSLKNVFAIGNTINYPGKVKNITCGLGEAVVAITKIDQIIHPGKNIPVHF